MRSTPYGVVYLNPQRKGHAVNFSAFRWSNYERRSQFKLNKLATFSTLGLTCFAYESHASNFWGNIRRRSAAAGCRRKKGQLVVMCVAPWTKHLHHVQLLNLSPRRRRRLSSNLETAKHKQATTALLLLLVSKPPKRSGGSRKTHQLRASNSLQTCCHEPWKLALNFMSFGLRGSFEGVMDFHFRNSHYPRSITEYQQIHLS